MFLLQRLHFDVSIDPSAPSPFPCSYTPSNPFCDSPNTPSSPSELSNLDGGFYNAHGQHISSSGSNSGALSVLPQQPRQKGRPRKRKPKDIEAMTANLGEFCKCESSINSHNQFLSLSLRLFKHHASAPCLVFLHLSQVAIAISIKSNSVIDLM